MRTSILLALGVLALGLSVAGSQGPVAAPAKNRTAAAIAALEPRATGPAPAQTEVRAVHGISAIAYQAWVDRANKDGLRLTYVQAYGPATAPEFAAIARKDGSRAAWVARHHLTSQEYQAEFDKWSAQGYRLTCLSGYADGNTTRFACVFLQDKAAPAWKAHHNQTSQDYQATFDAETRQGYRPVFLTGYPVGKSYRLASIFVADKVADWVAHHDLTADQYQKMFDDQVSKGYRPINLTAYPVGQDTRFGLILARTGTGDWVARHNLTASAYQAEFNKWTGQGYVLQQVVGYPRGGPIRYAAIWAKPMAVVRKGPLPMQGTAVAELAEFDRVMQKFMQDRSIQAGTLAVLRNGRVVLARGYGYRNPHAGTLLGPETPFRIASVTKPITLAGLMRLIRQGKLSLKTKAFVLLGVQPPPGQRMDKRLLDITIQDLIHHKGGWDRDKSGDPMFMSQKIARALGKAGPATADDIVTYMAGQPLDFTPGSKSVYSNFGYCVLGRVIARVSGKPYIDYMKETIFRPLHLKSLDLGRSLPRFRNPAEPVYLDPAFGTNLFDPKGPAVPAPDGTFCLEAMDAHGGLIASAPDLIRFFDAYWMDDGTPRRGGTRSNEFFGSLPGTWSVVLQRPDGVNLAALFNQRTDPSGRSYDDIASVLNRAADGIKQWPR